MRAFVAEKTDDGVTRGLRDVEVPAQGDVLIRVAYSSVNYKDALATIAKGGVARSSPLIPGIDLAGTVEEAPPGAAFAAGEEVLAHGYELGMAHDGGFAEFARVPAGLGRAAAAGADRARRDGASGPPATPRRCRSSRSSGAD